ncbi:protein of unknown function [Methylocaldum szegediense]|uniref:Uncharacterized protein n=1 Tax=Methylocaldum szegediense TaxID=73780 RepID=A0ABM9I5Y8_9GAMM|nr:protein of unknown function [Methylocaldum szegediense]
MFRHAAGWRFRLAGRPTTRVLQSGIHIESDVLARAAGTVVPSIRRLVSLKPINPHSLQFREHPYDLPLRLREAL